MLKLLLFTMLAIATQQICTTGCLKCTTEDQCLIPDVTRLYKLNDVTPEKVVKDGCLLIDFEGTCLACSPGKYLDVTLGDCVAAEPIDNCDVYANATTCVVCKTGFYLDAGSTACTAVEPLITRCNYYSSATECSSCDDGYLLAADVKSCVPNPAEDNCISYSFVSCASCKAGLVRTLNGYLQGWRSVDGSAAKAAVAALAGGGFSGLAAQTACETALASNCLTFEIGLNKCTACLPGFFITEKNLCVAYPDEKLANCAEYTSATVCTKCISSHNFVQGICTEIPKDSLKEFCVEYNTSSSSVQCVKCSNNYFLSNNSCSERDKSKDSAIANCETKSVSSDKCASCSNNMVLTGDGLQCNQAIANCQDYNTVNVGQVLSCNVCEPGHYRKENPSTGDASVPPTECIAGEVENCATYGSSATNCQICKNGYILVGTICTANNTLAGCTVFSSTDLQECATCTNTSSFNFVINNRCNTIINPVSNCLSHNGGTLTSPDCEECNTGYQLGGNSCTKINITHCLLLDSTNCTRCAAGYAIAEDSKTCIQPMSYVTDQCFENSTLGDNGVKVNAVTCSKCKEHAYPIDFANLYICVENDNLVQFDASLSTRVEGCLKYNSSFLCVQCDPNDTKMFLNVPGGGATNTCETECHATTPLYERVKLTHTTGDLEVDQFNVCVSPAGDCLMQGPNLDAADGAAVCIKCLPEIGAEKGYFPVVDITADDHSIVDPESTSYPYMPSPFAFFPEVTCNQFGADDINDTDSTNVAASACEYYHDVGGDDLCLRCHFGQVADIDATLGHLTDCAASNDFDSQTRYYNIHKRWEFFFSVHKCANDHIPVAGVNSVVTPLTGLVIDANPTGFVKWQGSLNSTLDFTFASGTAQKNIVCADYDGGTMFGLTSTEYTPVPNCALAALYVKTNGTTNISSNNYGVACAACKPGYEAEYETNEAHLVKTCTAILNCKSGGTLANTCQECETNYVLKYASDAIVFGTGVKCLGVPGSDQAKYEHCLAGTEGSNDSGTTTECNVCKKGYHLNLDGHCETINSAQCKTGNFRTKATFVKATAPYAMYLQAQGVGCNECEASHSAIQITSSKFCVNSSWIQTKVDSIVETETAYIPFCKFYNAEEVDPTKCIECDANYVIKGTTSEITGEMCYSATTLQNCAIAKSASACVKCVNDTFSLVNDSCTPGNIANCAAYNFDTLENTVKCRRCNPNFYLSTTNNTCLQGQIPNCKKFKDNEKSQCEECEDGHATAEISGNDVYCYPVSQELSCSTYNVSPNSKGATISCTICSNKATHLVVAPTGTDDKTICMDFVPVANCEGYDVGTTLSNSTFKCNKCAAAFYYSAESNACVARVNVPAKCTTFDINKDECTLCGQDSYLFNAKKECRDYPKGILGCEEYTDAATCTKCQPERYLTENSCPKADPVISDCLYYSSKTTCASCKATFVLVSNECKAANATDCVTYASIDACASCAATDGLETSGSITNCVRKEKNGCDLVSDNSPYNCIQCSNGFYLKEGECANPTNIENCVSYDTEDTCKLCKEGYALATNKKSCINTGVIGSHIPAGCIEANAVAVPVCSRCGPAYHFVQDACGQLCTGDDADGCLTCDPVETDKCLVCVSSYHQNKDGKCVMDVTTNPTEPDKISSSIVGSLIVFLVSLMVIVR